MEQTVKKQRVAVYCRTDANGGESSITHAAQEAYYTELISKHPEWELAGIYADKGGASADWQKRKAFKKMIAACQRGEIDLILVKSLSRFARRTADCLETVRMLKARGVGVIFEMEGIDTRMESGELMVTTFCELARRESESITSNLIYPAGRRI